MALKAQYRNTPTTEEDLGRPTKQHSIGSIRTVSGLIMLINFILLIMSVLLIATWRAKVMKENKKHHSDLDQLTMYFLGSILLPLLMFMLIYLKDIFIVQISIAPALANVLMSIFCLTCSTLILLSVGYLIPRINDRWCSDRRACAHLKGAVGSGIITAIGIFAQSVNHLIERKAKTFI
ncbi:uncharacterized protein [Clytia hemisphaerica]